MKGLQSNSRETASERVRSDEHYRAHGGRIERIRDVDFHALWNPPARQHQALLAKYVSRQYLDNTNSKERSLSDYYVQDLRASYTIKSKVIKETTLIFQLNNIFNEKYEPNGATYPYIYSGTIQNEVYLYPMAGMNFMAGVNVKF
ncbi:MAG: TonB-dependent receptor [Chitinophagaceae bacterium]|nr:TonB-dependent receptor [Chitinophagaceae bacterium]